MIEWCHAGQIKTLTLSLLVGLAFFYTSGCNSCNTDRTSPGAVEAEVHVEWPDAGSLLAPPSLIEKDD